MELLKDCNNIKYTNIGIPKIIHQIWLNETDLIFPEHWKISPKQWKNFHSDYIYILWENNTALEFIENEYPEYINKYKSLKYPIQRVDMLKYCLMYKYGGIYSDLDNYPTENIEKYLNDDNVDVFLVNLNIFMGIKTINNNLIITKPNIELFKEVLDEINSRKEKFFMLKCVEIGETNGLNQIKNLIKKYKTKI